ncbi:Ig-like domain-containing protein, partial [Curtobacterium sp. 22159]|uniref:Ig-like domain-containing protein n=1 Tax=Curtobacterium sp. 22159 TaxID=3453882 RepID=UPI003F84CF1E
MSKNKKTRIAKGLGASALAVATLASGLSFGSTSASAAEPAVPRAGQSLGSMQLVFKVGSRYAIPSYFSQIVSKSDSNAVGYYTTLEEAASRSTYEVIDSGRGDGRFALKNGGYCVAPEAGPTKTWYSGTVGQGHWVTYVPNSPIGATILTPGGANCGAHFGYSEGYLTFKGKIVGIGESNIPGTSYTCTAHGVGQSCVPPAPAIVGKHTGFKAGVEGVPLAGEHEAIKPFSAEWTFQDGRDDKSVISGRGKPDSAISIVDPDGKEVASTTTDAEGNYSVEIDAPDSGGEYTLTVKQTADDGTESTKSVSLDYGKAVEISSPVNESEQDESPITVQGTGEPGSEVVVSVNGTAGKPETVSEDGKWNKAVTISKGENTIEATQKSKGANTTTSKVVVNPGQSNIAPLVIETPANGSTVDTPSKRIEFAGTAEPESRVVIKTETGRTIIDAFADRDGKWSKLGDELNFGVAYRLLTEYTPQGESMVAGEHRVTLKDSDPGVVQDQRIDTPAAESM